MKKIHDFSVSALSFISIVLYPTYLMVAQMIVALPYFDFHSDWFSQYHLMPQDHPWTNNNGQGNGIYRLLSQ